MKKIILALMMVLLCRVSFATPPADLNLSYDPDKSTLRAQGHHPTQDLTVHYIRRMVVTVNDGEPKEFYFTRQSSAAEFDESVPIELKPNDKVHVEVFCSQGGSKAADLVISDTSQKDQTPVDLKTLRDKDHRSMPVIP